MTRADPGYPLDLGRKEVVGDGPRSYGVPRVWSSLPINCLVKIDVIDPKAVEVVPSLKALTAPAELIIRKCLLEGTQCGGSILVGPRRVLKLTLSYYTDVTGEDDGVLRVGRNGTDMAYTEA
ncbi:MAG: hypothetical protein L6R35_006513 [Caloplaca aegaea]|nr:MAG: hypothetical protein L6R35_006513 [Caloplaca aegaea]